MRVQTGEWVRILLRFLWYTGTGLLVSSIATLAVRFWLPEPSHTPLFILTHSLIGGVVVVLLLRSFGEVKAGSTGHNFIVRTSDEIGDFRSGCLPADRSVGDSATLPVGPRRVFPHHRPAPRRPDEFHCGFRAPRSSSK